MNIYIKNDREQNIHWRQAQNVSKISYTTLYSLFYIKHFRERENSQNRIQKSAKI